MEEHALLAVDRIGYLDPDLREPRRIPADDRGHRRQGLEPGLGHEAELELVSRLAAEAEAQRIEHRVALGVGPLDLGEDPLPELLVVHDLDPGQNDGGVMTQSVFTVPSPSARPRCGSRLGKMMLSPSSRTMHFSPTVIS